MTDLHAFSHIDEMLREIRAEQREHGTALAELDKKVAVMDERLTTVMTTSKDVKGRWYAMAGSALVAVFSWFLHAKH